MLANAIADARTNFFMQCSWEIPKWGSKNHSFASVGATVPVAFESWGDGYKDTMAKRVP
jgi:hypothetical protein